MSIKSKITYIFFLALMATLLTGSPQALAAGASGSQPDCSPNFIVSTSGSLWASYGDYQNRVLTVNETLQNLGECAQCSFSIVEVSADNGVGIDSSLPIELGELPAAASGNFQVRYRVPPGVASFHSRIRAVCRNLPDLPPASGSNLTIDPGFAYANEGCQPESSGVDEAPLPADTSYSARRFTVHLTNEDGTPAAGRQIKWSLSSDASFRIIDSTSVTDSNGEAYALVSPPLFFICIVPYFDRDTTTVGAYSDGLKAEAVFVYTRCHPAGDELPPWIGS